METMALSLFRNKYMLLTPELGLLIHDYTPTALLWVFCAAVVLFLFALKKYRDAFTVLYASGATTAAVVLLKFIFAVPRPEGALVELSSHAFPSGHAAAGMFIAVLCSWLVIKYAKEKTILLAICVTLLFIFGLLLGYSRLLISVHTVSQVLGGFAVGVLVPLTVIFLRR